MKEFRVNQYITVKLEDDKSNIYVNGEYFEQCKFLLLDIPMKTYETMEEIESVDEVAEKLDITMEGARKKDIEIPPEVEFWGHCSNLQVWSENNYNTRLLHRSLAFPLLKKLADLGDSLAKIRLKEEIVERFESGFFPVVEYLINEGYLRFFNNEEILDIFLDSEKIKEAINELSKVILDKFEVTTKFDFFEDHSLLSCFYIIIDNKHVIGVDINWYELNTFPNALFKFKFLKKLFLTNTKINELPSKFGELQLLEEIKLLNNNLTEIPNSFAKLELLKKLDIVGNRLRIFPESLTRLNSLKYLYLNQNDIRSIPESINNLKNL